MYRAMGQDRAALEVLYQMRVQEANVAGSRWMWPLNLFYRLTVGYGYKLHRAIALLLLLWAVGFGCLSAYAKAQSPDHAWHWAYGPGVCAPASPVLTDVVATQQDYCGSFVPVLYSLDAILPVVDLGQESAWYFQDPLWQFGMDLLQIGGWVLAAAAATFALNLVVRGDGGAGRPTEARWSRSG
jgi:hypothetical protein